MPYLFLAAVLLLAYFLLTGIGELVLWTVNFLIDHFLITLIGFWFISIVVRGKK